MKKFLITVLAAAMLSVFAVPANSQNIGLKAGINVSSLDMDGVKNYLGYQAGLAFQFDLPLWFSIQPDVLFHIKGARIEDTSLRAFGLGYLEVPVNVQWGPRFLDGNIRVFLQGSPFIGYAISKDLKDAQGNSYSWHNVNRFEYGVGAGFGVQLWRFQLTAQYNWSFGNLANSNLAEETFRTLFSESNFNGYTVSLAIMLF